MTPDTLTPGTITTLGQLRPGDVGEWLDCNKRFVCTRLHSYPGFGLCFDAAYEGGGGISEPWLDRPVRYLGRGRIEPARIVMDGERDRVAELEEQVRALRHALARELAELRARNDGGTHWDGCHESHPMCAAIQRIEAALVETDAKEKGKSSPIQLPGEPK